MPLQFCFLSQLQGAVPPFLPTPPQGGADSLRTGSSQIEAAAQRRATQTSPVGKTKVSIIRGCKSWRLLHASPWLSCARRESAIPFHEEKQAQNDWSRCTRLIRGRVSFSSMRVMLPPRCPSPHLGKGAGALKDATPNQRQPMEWLWSHTGAVWQDRARPHFPLGEHTP